MERVLAACIQGKSIGRFFCSYHAKLRTIGCPQTVRSAMVDTVYVLDDGNLVDPTFAVQIVLDKSTIGPRDPRTNVLVIMQRKVMYSRRNDVTRTASLHRVTRRNIT